MLKRSTFLYFMVFLFSLSLSLSLVNFPFFFFFFRVIILRKEEILLKKVTLNEKSLTVIAIAGSIIIIIIFNTEEKGFGFVRQISMEEPNFFFFFCEKFNSFVFFILFFLRRIYPEERFLRFLLLVLFQLLTNIMPPFSCLSLSRLVSTLWALAAVVFPFRLLVIQTGCVR